MGAQAATIRGSTRHLPEGADYEHFLESVCDLYVGVRPDRPRGPFPADFSLFDFGVVKAGLLETPGIDARRDRASIARLPDDDVFVNISPAPWELEHLGRHWAVPSNMPLILDNSETFQLSVDPKRPLRLYSIRIPKAALAPDAVHDLRRVNHRLQGSEMGRHFAAQSRLFIGMLDAGRANIAGKMGETLIALIDAVSASQSPLDRLDIFKRFARTRLVDPDFSITQLARHAGCSPRTVQNVFASAGERFSEWLASERLDIARERLSSADWADTSVEGVARASGFADASTFQRAFRRRFGRTPGSVR